ncbi:hypothetical protein DPMN_063871 [Dreissena polymorpha]|uniref:Uncharacterized protein n=1 Tax=Dreissena polymorpha TaxID=45954 RepID=A0A9D4CCL7_DREPO|nr:hypothetical protein DPMN_063871 [Dreissena polymorpha]
MIIGSCTVSVLLFFCVAGIVGQSTIRTVTTREFRYETACLDMDYGIVVSTYNKTVNRFKDGRIRGYNIIIGHTLFNMTSATEY